jgi:hypothetical protein
MFRSKKSPINFAKTDLQYQFLGWGFSSPQQISCERRYGHFHGLSHITQLHPKALVKSLNQRSPE